MYYINIKKGREVETIDEFETRKEANQMLSEYLLAYRGMGYDVYLSTRKTIDWEE
jgi:hypothetical protein